MSSLTPTGGRSSGTDPFYHSDDEFGELEDRTPGRLTPSSSIESLDSEDETEPVKQGTIIGTDNKTTHSVAVMDDDTIEATLNGTAPPPPGGTTPTAIAQQKVADAAKKTSWLAENWKGLGTAVGLGASIGGATAMGVAGTLGLGFIVALPPVGGVVALIGIGILVATQVGYLNEASNVIENFQNGFINGVKDGKTRQELNQEFPLAAFPDYRLHAKSNSPLDDYISKHKETTKLNISQQHWDPSKKTTKKDFDEDFKKHTQTVKESILNEIKKIAQTNGNIRDDFKTAIQNQTTLTPEFAEQIYTYKGIDGKEIDFRSAFDPIKTNAERNEDDAFKNLQKACENKSLEDIKKEQFEKKEEMV